MIPLLLQAIENKGFFFANPPNGAYLFAQGSATLGQNGVLRLV